jgi:site-specific recombinase XerD
VGLEWIGIDLERGLLQVTQTIQRIRKKGMVTTRAAKTDKSARRRFHDLRHTAASLLLAQGATLHDVKEILGHAQIALTSDLYGHAYTSALRETVDHVGSILAPSIPVAPSATNRRPN